jgi:integrase
MATAVEDGLIRSNPVAIKGAAAEHIPERPLLTWTDVDLLTAVIEPRFRALVWIAAISGLRFGELTALDRARIDLTVGTIRVDRALTVVKGTGPCFGPPKSLAAHRTVAIPPVGSSLLEVHLDAFVDARRDAVVFTSVKGSLLINGYFAPYWREAKRAAGIDPSVRFHDLRHLAGTEAATAGASLREVMTRMGHASSHAALHYLKAAEARDRDIADAIGARLTQTTAATSDF